MLLIYKLNFTEHKIASSPLIDTQMKETEKKHNQEDVNPTTQQDKILQIKEDGNSNEPVPVTNGTGSNRPIPTSGTVIVKEGDDEEGHQVENNPQNI